ncbi:MAG: hypothetical protein PHP57_01065 [Sideroxydans sp.]|nr:hypothetical protein [Sideroxydans sp.]
MSVDVLNRPSRDVLLMPTIHLLGIIQRIIATGQNTLVLLPGIGDVMIFPKRNEYYSSVKDMAEFCDAPIIKYKLVVIGESDLSTEQSVCRGLGELMWHFAFASPSAQLLDEYSIYDVVKFKQWPNLTRLPSTPNTSRIISLLTRHPTTLAHVQQKLKIESSEIHQVFNAAHYAGIVEVVSRARAKASAPCIQVKPSHEQNFFRSLFTKFAKP